MKPTPGEIYLTAQGDTLESIATMAYGDGNEYTKIQDVNSLSVNIEYDDELVAGTSLIIPVDSELDYLRNEQLSNALV